MICEICGKNFNNGVKVQIEGSVVSACANCSGYGKLVGKIETVKEKPKTPEAQARKYEMQDFESETALADDYGERIKKAREKRNLKQGDLAKLINEHESIVHRIESGRFEPDDDLIKKLEKKLDIKLTIKVDDALRLVGKGENKEKTLGDVVVIRKKKGGI
jgi:putative transcription factor